jgi:hypothetical protein
MPDLRVEFIPDAVYGPNQGGNQVIGKQISTFDVRGFALSPDGTRLAVMTSGWTPDGTSQVTTVSVLPVTAGAVARSWQVTVNSKTTPARDRDLLNGVRKPGVPRGGDPVPDIRQLLYRGIGAIEGIEWASPAGGVFVAGQGNGKATASSQAVAGPDGRTALVVVSGGQVTATIQLPAWAAGSPLFRGGHTATGW